ncbi:MAG: aspartate carbamoyltransferase, partial [Chloroflexi bacterium]|nr:aspartate carbamoyltransferase [Chloroflexota bacterium]
MSLSQTTAFEVEPPVGPQSNGDRPRQHLLDLDDFGTAEILTVLDNTSAMKEVLNRDIKKVPTLRGRVLVTLFYEPSTRTRISFEESGKILSADVINMGSSGSSVGK